MMETKEVSAFSELSLIHGGDADGGTSRADAVRLVIALNRTLQRIEDGTVAPEMAAVIERIGGVSRVREIADLFTKLVSGDGRWV